MAEPFRITTREGVLSKTVSATMETGGRKTSITATSGIFGTRYEVLSDFCGVLPHPARKRDDDPHGHVEVSERTVRIFYADGTLAATENREYAKLPNIEGVAAAGDEYSLGISGNFDAVHSLIRASSLLQGSLKMFERVAEEIGDIARPQG